jgi:hypothetical protein
LKLIFLKRALSLCIPILLLSFFNACKEPDTIGMNIQPMGDQLNVADTNFRLTAYTKKEDSIRSDETVYNLLGTNDDPVFGKNTASFYTQLRLSADNPTFGDTPVVDSVVLSLAYKKLYGDSFALQTVKVYEIARDIYKDSLYYSNREILTMGTVLGSKTFVPEPNDSVAIYSDTVAPHLRINLNKQWAKQKFLDAQGSSNLLNNTNFLNYFKGIYVASTGASGTGAIMGFDLLNSLSRITLYYHNNTQDSLKYNFVINENCARINHFSHSKYYYADPYLRSEISGGADTVKGDSILYIQSMAGLKVRIEFPTLKDLVKYGKIAVNKADLIVSLDDNDYTVSSYAPPPQLVLIEELDGKIRFLLDQYEGMTFYGGAYNSSKKEYKFNIARHIQQIIDGAKDNLGLSLIVWTADRPNSANRVVLKGPKRKTGNLRLEITYTKLY